MSRIEDIDNELLRYNYDLKNCLGTECEVYSRIVGYYRPVKNWNPGKKSEYERRVVFDKERAGIS
jgi:anaerobic ribonucleoside-triphosphate reductase